MNKLLIEGQRPLHGAIRISGAKNAALPLMCAALLCPEPITLHNVPYLRDVTTMATLLAQHGVALSLEEADPEYGWHGQCVCLDGSAITSFTAPYEIVRTMRASILVLGPLLARFGEARVSLPGGCAIGTRPVDLHLSALEQMGAVIELQDGYVLAHSPDGLHGADITFAKVSVGATENLLMAASLARGTTTLRNAAQEPEIGDLAQLLNAMGADISGIGSDTLTINGVSQLHSATHTVIADRIEAGSFLCMVGITGGEVDLIGAQAETNSALIALLQQSGLAISSIQHGLRVTHDGSRLRPAEVTTEPFPGFPTDMQAQLMALLSRADGISQIDETIFENRYMHVPELARMGCDIRIEGHTATIHGVAHLHAAPVMATDLRASMSLVIAALAAEGESVIDRVYHLDRGYERLEEKLTRCGAKIRRV